jgi:O-antigen/teichoic acid export membrane protein
MGRISATGSIQLFIGVVMSNVVLAVGTIILTRLLSPEEYGLYSVVLIPSVMMNLFRDWGMNSALTKYVAQYKMIGNEQDLHETIAAGLAFELSTGFILSLFLVSSSGFIASILNRPESAPLISIVAVATFSGSLLTAAQSSFVGFERMKLNSLTLICQGVVKGLLSPLLVLLGFGVLGAVLGYVVSFLATGIVGLVALYFLFLRKLNIAKPGFRQTSAIL